MSKNVEKINIEKEEDKFMQSNSSLYNIENKSGNSQIDYKINRIIITEFFRLMHSIKNYSFEAIKKESINYLTSTETDITEIIDFEKNTCNK